MAQVIDTTGKQRDTSRKANGLPQVVSGSSHGGGKAEPKPNQVVPEVESTGASDRFASRPFGRVTKSYGMTSGGNQITTASKPSWSPTYASMTKGDNGSDNIAWSGPGSIDVSMLSNEPKQFHYEEVNLPDLNPVIESMQEHFGNAMTDTSKNGMFLPSLSGGATPSVGSQSDLSSSGKADLPDLPDLSPAIDGLQDSLRGMMTDTNRPGSVEMSSLSTGAVPVIDPNDIGPNNNPLSANLPSLDDVRDSLLSAMTKPVDPDEAVVMPSLGTGATPVASRDSMRTSDGILDDIMDDPMRDYIGENDSNNAYIQDAIENGMSEKDAGYLRDRYGNDRNWFQDFAAATSLPLAMDRSQLDSRDQGGLMSGSFVLDDGSKYDYDHMTADSMTGTQYLHYAEMGMGGRPIEEIDPTAVYSKRRENINYGFVPFVPDSLSYRNMVIDNAMDVPARLGALVGRGREEIANRINPYGININGKHVDGPEFDRVGGAYVHQMERNEKYHPEKFLVPGDERAIPTVVEFPIPDSNGDITYHYGHLTGAYTDIAEDGSDVYGLEFSDGSDVEVSPDFFESLLTSDGMIDLSGVDRKIVTPDTASGQLPDLTAMNDIDEIMATDDPINNADVLWYPDLVMSDGTRLSYDEANSIYYDREIGDNPDDPYDDNITYDISKTIIPTLDNRPSRLNGEIFDENGVDLSSLGNNVVDWTLGSMPISIGTTMPWIYSASNASSSMSGIDPNSYDVGSDSYGLAYGNYNKNGDLRYGVTMPNGKIDKSMADEMQFWNMLGNAAVPLTEQIVGPVGEHGIPVRKLLNAELPANPSVLQVLGDLGVGMIEEGVEEDLGNIFDELTSYGPRGMFANQAIGKDGRPMYDLTGHEIRDYSTSGRDRMANALDVGDLANSFAGGALVDLAMQLGLPRSMSEFKGNMGNAMYANKVRKDLGLDRYVEPEPVENRQVSESYLDQFDDELAESIRR